MSAVVTLELANTLPRKCGGCTLCCKLLPVAEINKKAGVRCRHQAYGKGCRVYHNGLPASCRLWSCAWLTKSFNGPRPDRGHYVIDILPDYITVDPGEGGKQQLTIPVVQVWIDPDYPHAHRDPALRAYLAERSKDGVAALIRFNEREAFVLFPPAMTGGEWVEGRSNVAPVAQHSFAEIARALAK